MKVTLLGKEKDTQAINNDSDTGLQIFWWFSFNKKLKGCRKAVQATVLDDSPPCWYTIGCGIQISSLSGLPLALQKHLHSAKIHFLKFSHWKSSTQVYNPSYISYSSFLSQPSYLKTGLLTEWSTHTLLLCIFIYSLEAQCTKFVQWVGDGKIPQPCLCPLTVWEPCDISLQRGRHSRPASTG